MNAEIKKLWVDKLRDPATKQAKGALKRDDAFCCLGVLCDIYISATGLTSWETGDDVDGGVRIGFRIPGSKHVETAVLPVAVSNWAGLDSSDPHVYINLKDNNLTNVNDNIATFPEIADLIEAQL